MGGRSRVELDPKFRRLLQRLPSDMTDPLKATLADSAKAVYAEAIRRVPIRTGDLAHSLGLRIGSGGLSAEVGFDRKRFAKQWKMAGWRAKFTELGTKGSAARGIKPQSARPFLRPAFEANREWIIERHRKAVATVLDRAGTSA